MRSGYFKGHSVGYAELKKGVEPHLSDGYVNQEAQQALSDLFLKIDPTAMLETAILLEDKTLETFYRHVLFTKNENVDLNHSNPEIKILVVLEKFYTELTKICFDFTTLRSGQTENSHPEKNLNHSLRMLLILSQALRSKCMLFTLETLQDEAVQKRIQLSHQNKQVILSDVSIEQLLKYDRSLEAVLMAFKKVLTCCAEKNRLTSEEDRKLLSLFKPHFIEIFNQSILNDPKLLSEHTLAKTLVSAALSLTAYGEPILHDQTFRYWTARQKLYEFIEKYPESLVLFESMGNLKSDSTYQTYHLNFKNKKGVASYANFLALFFELLYESMSVDLAFLKNPADAYTQQIMAREMFFGMHLNALKSEIQTGTGDRFFVSFLALREKAEAAYHEAVVDVKRLTALKGTNESNLYPIVNLLEKTNQAQEREKRALRHVEAVKKVFPIPLFFTEGELVDLTKKASSEESVRRILKRYQIQQNKKESRSMPGRDFVEMFPPSFPIGNEEWLDRDIHNLMKVLNYYWDASEESLEILFQASECALMNAHYFESALHPLNRLFFCLNKLTKHLMDSKRAITYLELKRVNSQALRKYSAVIEAYLTELSHALFPSFDLDEISCNLKKDLSNPLSLYTPIFTRNAILKMGRMAKKSVDPDVFSMQEAFRCYLLKAMDQVISVKAPHQIWVPEALYAFVYHCHQRVDYFTNEQILTYTLFIYLERARGAYQGTLQKVLNIKRFSDNAIQRMSESGEILSISDRAHDWLKNMPQEEVNDLSREDNNTPASFLFKAVRSLCLPLDRVLNEDRETGFFFFLQKFDRAMEKGKYSNEHAIILYKYLVSLCGKKNEHHQLFSQEAFVKMVPGLIVASAGGRVPNSLQIILSTLRRAKYDNHPEIWYLNWDYQEWQNLGEKTNLNDFMKAYYTMCNNHENIIRIDPRLRFFFHTSLLSHLVALFEEVILSNARIKLEDTPEIMNVSQSVISNFPFPRGVKSNPHPAYNIKEFKRAYLLNRHARDLINFYFFVKLKTKSRGSIKPQNDLSEATHLITLDILKYQDMIEEMLPLPQKVADSFDDFLRTWNTLSVSDLFSFQEEDEEKPLYSRTIYPAIFVSLINLLCAIQTLPEESYQKWPKERRESFKLFLIDLFGIKGDLNSFHFELLNILPDPDVVLKLNKKADKWFFEDDPTTCLVFSLFYTRIPKGFLSNFAYQTFSVKFIKLLSAEIQRIFFSLSFENKEEEALVAQQASFMPQPVWGRPLPVIGTTAPVKRAASLERTRNML